MAVVALIDIHNLASILRWRVRYGEGLAATGDRNGYRAFAEVKIRPAFDNRGTGAGDAGRNPSDRTCG